MAVDVFVQQIPERAGACGVAGLRAKGAQPHEIAGLNLDPIRVQFVDRLAFQHIKPVFHDMGFFKGNNPARLEGDDIDLHIMAQVVILDKAGGGPAVLGVGHRVGGDERFVRHKGVGRGPAGGGFVQLANPV